MLSLSRFCIFALSLAWVATAGLAQAPPPAPGTDIRSWATADISSRLSFAGTWTPLDTGAALVGPFWNVMKLGGSQLEGVVMAGWAWNDSFTSTLPDVTPTRAVVLEQQADGRLLEATTRVLGNPVTNGVGSVIVADFNGDGLDDLLLPAHNESPFLWKPSTAYVSHSGGGLSKLMLTDSVMDHDARLVTVDGQKKVIARSFGGSGNHGQGPGFHVVYTWSGTGFAVDTSLGDLGGMSVLAGPFTGDGDNWLIIGDAQSGPALRYDPTNPMLNYAYKFNNRIVTLPPILLPKPYFNDKPQYAQFISEWDPYSKTHTSRLWSTDLNQDGLPDILAGQEIWSSSVPEGLQKAVFQLLLNRGNMNFTDETDALAPEFSQDSYIDYNVRFVDVDGSGIDTMFLSSNQSFTENTDPVKQGQYILVNDGTGRLYAAMHSEFRAMTGQIAAYLRTRLPAGSFVGPGLTPQYVAYRTPNGAINFLAQTRYDGPTQAPKSVAFVNVALQINLRTDVRRDLTIPTRNGSRRIRTFAGNDMIYRALSDPDCTVDGGLGVNTVVYPGMRADWEISRLGDTIRVRPATGAAGIDTLTRIQIAKFDDGAVDLTAPN